MHDYPVISIAEIRRRYGPGEFRLWFAPETLAAHDTRLPRVGWRTSHGNFFITSDRKRGEHLRSTIRHQDLESGDITIVGFLCQHFSWQDARHVLTEHLRKLEAACAPV